MSKRFDYEPVWRPSGTTESLDIYIGLRDYMVSVYRYMALGLGLTGLVAFLSASSEAFMGIIFGSPLRWLVMFAPVGIVFFLGSRLKSLPLKAAEALFWAYSGLMGLSLSIVFLVFTGESIARLFFISSSVFGAMSLYGYTTRKDLTSLGSFLIMGIMGLVITSLVNLFFQSDSLQMIISIVGILAFTGLTAYDTQKIKESYLEEDSLEREGKKAIFGALMLYLDFVNLFIHLLHVFGERRRDQ